MVINPIPESVRQRIIGSLFITQSLFSGAMIASFTIMSITAAQLSGSDSAAGIPNTVSLLARAATAYPIGWLMDRVGRRLGLSLGYLMGVVGMVVAAIAILSGSFLGFCAGAALFGMGRGSAEQSRYVAAEVETAEKRAKIIGLIVFAGTVGSVGGPQLVEPVSRLAAQYGLVAEMGPYLGAAFLIFLCLLLTFFSLRPDPLQLGRSIADHEAKRDNTVRSEIRPLRHIFVQPSVILATASMVISQLVMTTIMVITPLHMNHHDHSIGAISNVLMAHTLGMFGLAGVTGWLIDRYGRIPMIITGALILILSSIMSPLSNSVWFLAVALFLLGLGWNFCFVAGSSLLSDALSPDERGQVQGANEMLVALASGVGSLGTGVMFDRGGMTAVSAVGLAIALVLLAIVVWSGINGRKNARLTAERPL